MSTDMIDSVHDAGKDNIDRTVSGLKNGISSITQGMGHTQSAARDGMQKAMKTAEDMTSFAQSNMEAVARSGQIMAAGVQDMGQGMAAAARASMDEMLDTFKAMASVRSVKDAMELQSGMVRAVLGKAVSHASQMTDSGMKLSEQAIAPIAARFPAAIETFGRIG